MEYSKRRILKKAIPDNDPNGLIDVVQVTRDLTVKAISVSVNIKHPYSGDISVELTGPDGKKKTLLSPSRVPGKNLKATFSGQDTESLLGGKSRGDWSLKVIDSGAKDEGTLEDWSLDLTLANSKKSEIIVDDHAVLKSVQVCHQGSKVTAISGKVNIEHSHIGDLTVDLTSPSGKKVTLHNKTGGASKNLVKSFSQDDLKELIGESAKGKWTLSVSDTLKGDAGRLVSWGLNIKTSKKAKTSNKKDDLTKIEGIGPKIKELLYNDKIFSFTQLANTNPADIKKILEAAGPRYQMHDPTSWPKQSKLAAENKWDALKKLQDELDGGR